MTFEPSRAAIAARHYVPCAVMLMLCLVSYSSAESDRASSEEKAVGYPAARTLLDGVLQAIPDVPVALLAEVQSRNAHGKLDRLIRLESTLHMGAEDYEATYQLSDAFGAETERLSVSGQPRTERGLTYTYHRGDPPVAADVPDLTQPVAETDLSWADLTLSFLWWPGAQTVGMDTIKGRSCYVIDIPVPAAEERAYEAVRIWIDPEIHMFLRAEGFDAEGEKTRRLEVKSFKKLNEMWLIKNIEVKTYPSLHRTIVRVRSVDEL